MPDPLTTPAPPLTKTLVPQEFHDRGYLKDWLEKPFTPELAADVFKKLDGAESLIGKKTLIPGADAKPEEWDQFLGKLRPEKADDYDYNFGEKADKDFVKTFKEAAHHAGIGKVQLNRQLEKLAPFFQAREKAVVDATAKRDTEFEAMVKTAVGPEHVKKQSRVETAIRELAPEGAKQFIDKLDDKNAVLMVAVIDAILNKYAGEDDFKADGSGGNASDTDKAALTKELHTLYASPGWNFQHPDHEKTKKRIDEILASPVFK